MIAEIFGYALVVALASPPLLWLVAPASPLPLAAPAHAAADLGSLSTYAQMDWDTTLLSLWIAATTLLAVLYVAAWLRLALQAKRWPRETTDMVSVVVADDVGPAVLGFVRPWIVLPRWLMDAPAAMRSTVVAHELEHIAARDQAWIVAAQLVTILLPWNLPLWWFVRRLRAAIEIDCDSRVLRRGTDPAQYADVLLAVGQHGPASAYVAVTLIEPVTQLERRIRIMLNKPRSASVARVSTATALATGLAACATQLEPPVVITTSPPDTATNAISRIETGPGATDVRLTLGPDGELTLEASELVMRVEDPARWRASSQQVDVTGDSALFEGKVQLAGDTHDSWLLVRDVRLSLDGVSILASRARATQEPNGATTLTLSDAKVVRAATSAE